MKITYIFHDGFLVDMPGCQIVFDFWRNHPSSTGDVKLLFDKDKPLYVFVSHFHKDHYNPDVFLWRKERDNVRYILSKDVAKRARPYYRTDSRYCGERKVPEECITVLCEGERFEDGNISVLAFGSTDIGCSWMVECGEKRIFHAGDLNAWIWKDESTEEEVKEAIEDFLGKLAPIKEVTDYFDAVMFPVDARIGSGYYTGARLFLEKFNARIFVPMHFGLAESAEQEEYFIRAASRSDLYASGNTGIIAMLTGSYSSIETTD